MHDWSVTVLQGASGLLTLLLGAWVATVTPRSGATTMFALFATGFGGYFLTVNAGLLLHVPYASLALPLLVWTSVLAIGIYGMFFHFPQGLARADRPIVLAALGLSALLSLARFTTWAQTGFTATSPLLVVLGVVDRVAFPGLYGYALLLALRFGRARDEAPRRVLALAGAAVLLYPAFSAFGGPGGNNLVHDAPRALVYASQVVAALLVAGAWLAATRGPDPAIARNMTLLAVALPLAGLVVAANRLEGSIGLVRILSAAVLAYAILRHQLLGLDVKVRFAISKSTIAAAFIAAFFLASEGAQLVFGAENEWVGLFAAGALVFAIAPLQRAAERLAEKAVPVAEAGSEGRVLEAAGSRERVYREAVRYALRDGLTRREEAHLAALAQELGLGAADALRLRHEVEDDPSGGTA